jgi:hypothetical protein
MRTFWEDFDDQIFVCILNYGFPPLSPFFFSENNDLDRVVIFVNNEFIMITCKVTCVIQSSLSSHYFHSVNVDNYGLPYVLKTFKP